MDLARLRDEYQRWRRGATLAAGAVVVMLALNLALVRWVGGFVLLLAPLGWFVRTGLRMRVLRRVLGRAAEENGARAR